MVHPHCPRTPPAIPLAGNASPQKGTACPQPGGAWMIRLFRVVVQRSLRHQHWRVASQCRGRHHAGVGGGHGGVWGWHGGRGVLLDMGGWVLHLRGGGPCVLHWILHADAGITWHWVLRGILLHCPANRQHSCAAPGADRRGVHGLVHGRLCHGGHARGHGLHLGVRGSVLLRARLGVPAGDVGLLDHRGHVDGVRRWDLIRVIRLHHGSRVDARRADGGRGDHPEL
mmetsp:Transcript_93317/g.156811  ORF Transcript_93317/g.156811 Transcript_93317/m.156811 type:complete len:227 (+) Transcript_93317:93-773(+)